MQLAVEFRRRPSALVYMARAFHRAQPLRAAGGFPALRLTWRGVPAQGPQLAQFIALTGLAADRALPLLYPHVIGFRLQMALLTHPAYPLPIWRALQVRNHLRQHRPLPIDRCFDLQVSVGEQRFLDKGLEVDLHTTAGPGGAIDWESTVTFYYRGRYGPPGPASPQALAPDAGAEEIAHWRTASGTGIRFGRLTGDYNGIHLWTPYARLFGFPRAFQHPQLVLGQCMARVHGPDAERPQRLDAWLKGPVFHGAQVALRARCEADATTFALFPEHDPRPAIVSRWSAAEMGEPPDRPREPSPAR